MDKVETQERKRISECRGVTFISKNDRHFAFAPVCLHAMHNSAEIHAKTNTPETVAPERMQLQAALMSQCQPKLPTDQDVLELHPPCSAFLVRSGSTPLRSP